MIRCWLIVASDGDSEAITSKEANSGLKNQHGKTVGLDNFLPIFSNGGCFSGSSSSWHPPVMRIEQCLEQPWYQSRCFKKIHLLPSHEDTDALRLMLLALGSKALAAAAPTAAG